MSPESGTWDDYVSPDPRAGHLKYEPPVTTELDLVRMQITHTELSIQGLELALDTARNRLKYLHRKHTDLLLADAAQAEEDRKEHM